VCCWVLVQERYTEQAEHLLVELPARSTLAGQHGITPLTFNVDMEDAHNNYQLGFIITASRLRARNYGVRIPPRPPSSQAPQSVLRLFEFTFGGPVGRAGYAHGQEASGEDRAPSRHYRSSRGWPCLS
jgi:hypothetical protein